MTILIELAKKANEIVPSEGTWRVYFLGFSRSGWSRGALAYQEEVTREPVMGQNWRSVGMRLLDLTDVDRDLVAWSQ